MSFQVSVVQVAVEVALMRYWYFESATVDSVCASHEMSMALAADADAVAVKFVGVFTTPAWMLSNVGTSCAGL